MKRFGLSNRVAYSGSNVPQTHHIFGSSFRLLGASTDTNPVFGLKNLPVTFYSVGEDDGYTTELVSGDVFSMMDRDGKPKYFDRVEVNKIPVNNVSNFSYLFDVSCDNQIPIDSENLLYSSQTAGVLVVTPSATGTFAPIFNKFLTRIRVVLNVTTFVTNYEYKIMINPAGAGTIPIFQQSISAIGNVVVDIPLNIIGCMYSPGGLFTVDMGGAGNVFLINTHLWGR